MCNNKRAIIRLAVEEDDIRKIEAICEKRGMTQISAMSRLVKWLTRQDYDIQTDILTTGSDNSSKETSLKLLKRIANAARSSE